MQILIALLLIIAPNCKQLRCLSTGDWLNKQWHIYTMEYYSAIKGVNHYTYNNMVKVKGIMASERN